MANKECVAMILAGGQGSRLGVLTKDIAKPAVYFGGKYRIIDFPLSNCVNSNIDIVGVLTQYQPLELNTYIGSGQPWDLDRINGGVFVLPPYMSADKGEWYKGTANAIYQNINFIKQFDPKYVLILSGDHIYKMDYAEMLQHHIKQNAAATIAVIEVPWKEASRFGIMSADEENKVTKFEEKPKNPESNLASMGIYIFNWSLLKKYLVADDADKASSNDFGKDIIPKMLDNGESMYAFPFSGYWKDVGNFSSLLEAHMDLLSDSPNFDLHDSQWRFYSRNAVKPPHFVSQHAKVSNCCIAEGCNIYGTVEHSVLFQGVHVFDNAIIKDSVIMPNTRIGYGARIENSIIGANTVIGEFAEIGCSDEECSKHHSNICSDGISVVGHDLYICSGTKIPKNCMVGEDITEQKMHISELHKMKELAEGSVKIG